MTQPADWQWMMTRIGAALAAFVVLTVICRGKNRVVRFVRALSMACVSILACVVALELTFRYWFVSSDGFGQSLTARRWMEKYWRPINSLGYRDFEVPTNADPSKVVTVVGDSFVAGQGAEDIHRRFAGVLQSQLGRDWRVCVVAQCGWSTDQELDAATHFPIPAGRTVLSYYINDIETAGQKNGLTCPPLTLVQNPKVEWFVNTSYLASFCYWRLIRFSNSQEMADIYWKHLQRCHNDPKVWETHRKDLLGFVELARTRHSKLTVVVFPALFAVEQSLPYTRKVSSLFREAGVDVIEVEKLIAGKKTSELVVSRHDAHPSLKLHSQVARSLSDSILR